MQPHPTTDGDWSRHVQAVGIAVSGTRARPRATSVQSGRGSGVVHGRSAAAASPTPAAAAAAVPLWDATGPAAVPPWDAEGDESGAPVAP